jgi:CheY-like chemotaxis protein
LILVVDDYADSRELYADYLDYSGFSVEQAATGSEALRKAIAGVPDLILMDLSLPDVDGWEATRRLKADGRTRQIPVLALTAHAMRSHAKSAQEAGCDGFIAKPCELPDLVEIISKTLDERAAREPTPNDGGTS